MTFFIFFNPKIRTILITGTNGKSTICKVLEHVFKENKINVKLGGNIGKPILDLDIKGNPLFIIEASSFQLAYSKFIKPKSAVILNVIKDHLDWHGSFKNYLNSKFNIFAKQNNKDIAYLNNKFLIKKFLREKYKSKLKTVNIKHYLKIKDKIKNEYLKTSVDDGNMSFVYAISKKFNFKQQTVIKSLKSFKGLLIGKNSFIKKKI